MIVTDRQYFMEPSLLEKLDLMCKRCSGNYNHQNLIITDGIEGYGKTTLTADAAYYMAYQMKRPLKLFFDPEKLMEESIKNKDEILIWDDAAYAALTVEAYNKIIIKLIKVIWLARKKRHTYFINMQEIFRLKELIVSRAIALLHVYSPDEISLGKAVYFSRRSKDILYEVWQRRKSKYYHKYYNFRFNFPDALGKIFDLKEYDTLKDHAILGINEEETSARQDVLQRLKIVRKLYATLPLPVKDLANHAKVTEGAIRNWKAFGIDPPVVVFNEQEKGITIKGYIEPSPLITSRTHPQQFKGDTII